MQITMDDSRITSIAQIQVFLKASQKVAVSLEDESIEKKYEFIDETLKKFSYKTLVKKEKNIVLWYIQKVTGYKKERVYQLVAKAEHRKLKRALYERVKSAKIYTSSDVKLLEQTDELHLRL